MGFCLNKDLRADICTLQRFVMRREILHAAFWDSDHLESNISDRYRYLNFEALKNIPILRHKV